MPETDTRPSAGIALAGLPQRHVPSRLPADVPLAWRLLWEGFGWPLRAFADYKNGSLMESDANITGEAPALVQLSPCCHCRCRAS